MRILRSAGIVVLVGSVVLAYYTGNLYDLIVGPIVGITMIAVGRDQTQRKIEPQVTENTPTIHKETIIQREIVKVPCKYCGTLVDPVPNNKCPSCGAKIF